MSRWAWLALTGFGVLAVWVRQVGVLPGDAIGLEFLQSHGVPGHSLFTLIGSIPGIIVLTLVAAWLCREWLRPLPLVAVMAGGSVLEAALKILIHRERPIEASLGFPSGHAIASLTLTLLVVSSIWRALSFWGKVLSVILGALFVLGVTISRAASGLHWPSDIVGGWMVAVAYGIWMIPVVRRSART